MPEIEVPCPTCSGTANMTPGGGRNNLKDRCTTCGGRRTIPARPGESRETSWPFAVPGAPQPPSSTPGEVERLVERLETLARQHETLLYGPGQGLEAARVADEIKLTRTALLSHISTAGRGEGDGDLWCVHVLGPDDVYAAPDLMTAVRWAQAMNRVADRAEQKIANRLGRPLTDDDRVLCYASVVSWPGSAEDHAAALPAAIRQMEPRTPPAPPAALSAADATNPTERSA